MRISSWTDRNAKYNYAYHCCKICIPGMGGYRYGMHPRYGYGMHPIPVGIYMRYSHICTIVEGLHIIHTCRPPEANMGGFKMMPTWGASKWCQHGRLQNDANMGGFKMKPAMILEPPLLAYTKPCALHTSLHISHTCTIGGMILKLLMLACTTAGVTWSVMKRQCSRTRASCTMYACIYIYIYTICILLFIYVCAFHVKHSFQLHNNVCVHIYIYTHTHIHTHTCKHMYIYIYIYIYACVFFIFDCLECHRPVSNAPQCLYIMHACAHVYLISYTACMDMQHLYMPVCVPVASGMEKKYVYAYIFVYIYVCVYIYRYVYVYISLSSKLECESSYIHINIYTYTYLMREYTYTYIHTHAWYMGTYK